MPKILHFADAHIDMANYGRHDPQTGLPMRVMDFLKSLDTIIDTAINERVDMVLFAGDAYKDRTPAPTFQREWGKRIMRLSRAGIPSLLLVGNHDLSPGIGRAHAIEEFNTLEVPHVRVLDRPQFLGPQDLEGLPLQVLALPWVFRSGLMAALEMAATDTVQVYEELEKRLTELVYKWLEEKVDPSLPTILAAHCSVQGAVYGGERAVMLGSDLVLSGALVKDSRLDYVALGHIHKPQNLNEQSHPPVIYPGSIERVDFGEVKDDKFFVIAHVQRGSTRVEWRKLEGVRPFIDRYLRLDSDENITERMLAAMPEPEQIRNGIIRLTLEYPRDLEPLIDETALWECAAEAFEFHLVKHPLIETRIRLPEDTAISSLPPLDLLNLYWRASHTDSLESDELQKLASEVIEDVHRDQEINP
jgi:DNA repair protein SbcD/Mre11